MKTCILNLFFCLFLIGKSSAQQNLLENSSFEEDIPVCCQVPVYWYDCADPFEKVTPVDIQPGSFGVTKHAAEGHNYLGMVVRDNGTTESIGQTLSEELRKDSMYLLTISVSRSEMYASISITTGQPAQYSTPVVLKIWGGSRYCERHQLLGITEPVTNTEWMEYEFDIFPETDISDISLEACFDEKTKFSYNGNILIDNIILTKTP